MRHTRTLRGLAAIALMFAIMTPTAAWAQDGAPRKGRESVDIFLDDEQLDVEADIPSVELVLTFKGLRYETIELKRTFLPALYETVEQKPF